MKDVIAIVRLSGFCIEAVPDILKDRLGMTEIFPGLAIELPENSVFTNGQEEILSAVVHQHAFEDNVESRDSAGAC
jgi:hypothetical protein